VTDPHPCQMTPSPTLPQGGGRKEGRENISYAGAAFLQKTLCSVAMSATTSSLASV
jgi:hypothetical protein